MHTLTREILYKLGVNRLDGVVYGNGRVCADFCPLLEKYVLCENMCETQYRIFKKGFRNMRYRHLPSIVVTSTALAPWCSDTLNNMPKNAFLVLQKRVGLMQYLPNIKIMQRSVCSTSENPETSPTARYFHSYYLLTLAGPGRLLIPPPRIISHRAR